MGTDMMRGETWTSLFGFEASSERIDGCPMYSLENLSR